MTEKVVIALEKVNKAVHADCGEAGMNRGEAGR